MRLAPVGKMIDALLVVLFKTEIVEGHSNVPEAVGRAAPAWQQDDLVAESAVRHRQ